MRILRAVLLLASLQFVPSTSSDSNELFITIRPEPGTGKWQYSLSRFLFQPDNLYEYLGDITNSTAKDKVVRVYVGQNDDLYPRDPFREVAWTTITVDVARTKLIPFILRQFSPTEYPTRSLVITAAPSKEIKMLLNTFFKEFGKKKHFQDITIAYYDESTESFLQGQIDSEDVQFLTLTGSWPNESRAILKNYLTKTKTARVTLSATNQIKFDKELVDLVIGNFNKGRLEKLKNVAGPIDVDVAYVKSHKGGQTQEQSKSIMWFSPNQVESLEFKVEGKKASFTTEYVMFN